MTDSTIANLNDISGNGGVQGNDMFYVLRQGTPDADFRADADAVLSYIETTATAFSTSGHGHVLADISDAGSLAGLNDVGSAQIQNDAITYAKVQDVSATDKILGRASAGSGVIEEITCTGAARSLLADVSAAAMRTTLGLAAVAATGSYADLSGAPSLGALAAKSSVDLGTAEATGTLAASRFPALSGDLTTTAGSLSAAIASNVVTNAKAAQMASATIKGNNTGATANAADLSASQVTAMLNAVVGDSGSGGTKGLVPAPSSGDAAAGKYLKADGTWAAPSGGGGGSGDTNDSLFFGDGSDGNVTLSSGTTTLTRDMYYNNLTLSGTASINNGVFRIFVAGTLDLTAAPAGAIIAAAAATGGNASANTGGAATNQTALGANKPIGIGMNSVAGSNGSNAAGIAGAASAIATFFGGLGGCGGNGEKGGNGAASTGGSIGTSSLAGGCDPRYATLAPFYYGSVPLISAGQCGASGGGGGGDGGASGGGGAGGAGGNPVVIYANTISRGASTATGCITTTGGNGGNGGVPTSGNRGGGAGGSGGGGGPVYIVYKTLTGTGKSGAITSIGGSGGNGGNGIGTGMGGYGGAGGKGGAVILVQIGGTVSCGFGTRTASPSGLAGGANTTLTGGIGAGGETLSVTI
ncbi:MAG: hypothetical protein JWO78_1298 [Micavibrio sp.]|nr:hypothetical protein [Micavibrio sp.]